MSADIEPLHKKIGWSATAAAVDASNRVPETAPFIALWLETDAEGEQTVKWSKANVGYKEYCFIALALMEFAQSCVRDAIERKGK